MQFIAFVALIALCSLTESRYLETRTGDSEEEPKSKENSTESGESNEEIKVNPFEVLEFDLNRKDGVLSFGGRIPAFDFANFNKRFNEMFVSILKRLNEAKVREELPKNNNNTKVDIITINGKKYRKETTVINKNINGFKVFTKSIVIVPLEEANTGSNEDKSKSDEETPKSEDKPKKEEEEKKESEGKEKEKDKKETEEKNKSGEENREREETTEANKGERTESSKPEKLQKKSETTEAPKPAESTDGKNNVNEKKKETEKEA